ncbi:MAG: DUF1802 family protein [Verrucomicrobia bacterium]|nr:DUF1802 family protein [Verrucomicrobiota bacterium]
MINVSASRAETQLCLPGFKEWALVCDSIDRGESSLIFRKGGIAEGRSGFSFKHDRFLLFPTFFHEQISQTRLAPDRDLRPQTEWIRISLLVEVERSFWIDNLSVLKPLSPLHVLADSVLEQRFNYNYPKGLFVAFVRAFRISPAQNLAFQRSYGGCRSWVDLPALSSDIEVSPVLFDEEHAIRRQRVDLALKR